MARREAPLVYIDTTEWVKFKKILDQDKFGKKLATQLRKRIKEIGNRGVTAVRAKLDEPTPAGNPSGDGLAAIAATLKTVVSFTQASAGVKITASASRLDSAHKGLLNVYNMKSFNNPKANTGRGNPYFGAVLWRVADKQLISEMREAMQIALEGIGARGK